jgi:hypothetical protein
MWCPFLVTDNTAIFLERYGPNNDVNKVRMRNMVNCCWVDYTFWCGWYRQTFYCSFVIRYISMQQAAAFQGHGKHSRPAPRILGDLQLARSEPLGSILRHLPSRCISCHNQEKTAVSECLLLLGSESFVFQFTVQVYKDSYIQKRNCYCCVVRVWSLVSQIEERRPRTFENRVLRKIFLPKEDVIGDCVCIINTDQNWTIVWHVCKRLAYRVLVRKPEGKRQHGRPRRWWEDQRRIQVLWGIKLIRFLGPSLRKK